MQRVSILFIVSSCWEFGREEKRCSFLEGSVPPKSGRKIGKGFSEYFGVLFVDKFTMVLIVQSRQSAIGQGATYIVSDSNDQEPYVFCDV